VAHAMSKPSRVRLVLPIATVTGLVLVLTSAAFTGLAGAIGAYVTPHPLSSDPIVGGPWSGYGVRTTSAAVPIDVMDGTWIQPGINCPAVYASEVIGAGLDHYGARIDGVGTLTLCVLGTPVYFAWVDQAPAAATLLPLAVSPGDRFTASVTTSGYTFTDITTATSLSGVWTGTLSTAVTHNSAECIVTRGPTLGLAPSLFNPLPTSSPTTLQDRVLFGSLYTSVPGCDYGNSASGAIYGIGTVPPPYVGYTFKLSNPPPAGSFIQPLPLSSGLMPLDSFVIA